jgi:hypothetical protein
MPTIVKSSKHSKSDLHFECTTNQKEIFMFRTITATYASKAAVTNVVDELINGGLPSEKMSIDDDTMQVMVKIPENEVSGIMAILNRHEPTKIL